MSGRTVTSDGVQRWNEVGEGPPLLLLHGIYAGAGSHEWDQLVPYLSDKRRVRVADLLGFGESDRPALQFTPEVVARSVAALIADAPKDATVVASSLTGAYALEVVARENRGRRVVLVTPTGLGKTQTGRSPLGSLAEVALRRSPLGDALSGLLVSRPSVRWFLSNQAYKDGGLVTDAVVDAYSTSGSHPQAKYPLVAFVTNQLAYRVDPSHVAIVRPTVVWARGQKFTNDAERDRWSSLGAKVTTFESGQPQAEEPALIADLCCDGEPATSR